MMDKLFASFLFLLVAMGMVSYAGKSYAEAPVEAPEETTSPDDDQTRIPDSCPNCGMG